MRRIVPDTNVLVSAIVFGGKPREVLQAAISGRIKLVLSEILLEELKGVLEGPKFRYPSQVILKILEELRCVAEVVRPALRIDHIVSDPDDDRVLECAVAGKAELIVSGDLHLLNLREFRGILIWPPARLMSDLERRV